MHDIGGPFSALGRTNLLFLGTFFQCKSCLLKDNKSSAKEKVMNSIIYLVGLVVVVGAILSFLGFI